MATTRLLLSCPDRPGIVARVAGFLADADRNIIDADQHSTDEGSCSCASSSSRPRKASIAMRFQT
jgi:formyltetrahydrofolate hydrolase